MPEFRYQAADHRGRSAAGRLTATGRTEALAALRERGLTPLRLTEFGSARSGRRAGRPGAADALAFTQQLSTLVNAGLQLDRALGIMAELSREERMGGIVAAVRRDLQEGAAFSAALARHARLFDRVYLNMVRAGETGGILPLVLKRLAETLEEEQELRSFILSAVLYPALVATVSLGAVLVLLIGVLPRFEEIFAQLGQDLPAITRITLNLSHLLSRYGIWTAVGLIVIGVILSSARRSPERREEIDRRRLRRPLLGDLRLKLATARFTRTLAMLVEAGVPMLHSFAVVREVVRNRAFAAALDRTGREIKEGGGVAGRLAAQKILPPLAVQMIAVGEETGEMPAMLAQVAKTYETQVRRAVRRLISLLEPVLILSLTFITLLIALSILIPIVRINTGVGL